MKLYEVFGQGRARAGEDEWRNQSTRNASRWTIVLSNGQTYGDFDSLEAADAERRAKGIQGAKVRPRSEVVKKQGLSRR